MSLIIGDLAAILKLDGTSQFNSALAGAGKALSAAGVAAAASLAAVAVSGVKMAMDFEKNMANVGTLLGKDGSGRVNELNADVKRLAQETGKPLEDLAGGLYQVVSAFGDTSDSAKLLEIAAKASSAGLSTTLQSVDLLSAVTKGYGDTSVEAVQKVSDLAFQTVKMGQTDFPSLAAAMGRVTPLAASLGVSMEEMFGVMATGTGVTGGAAEVSTQLRGILQAMMAPTEDMASYLESMGYSSGSAMLQQEGLQQSIAMLVARAEETGMPLQKLIGSIEGQTLALALAGPQADSFTQKLGAMANASGLTDEAFKIQQATFDSMVQKLKQSVNVALVSLGEQFLPALQNLADWVIQHMPQIQGFFESVFKAIGKAVSWVSENVLPLFQKAFEGSSGTAAAAMQLLKDKLGPIFEAIWSVVKTVVEAITILWRTWGDDIMRIGLAAWQAYLKVVENVLKMVKGALDVFIGLFTGDWKRFMSGIDTMWAALWDGIWALVKGAWAVGSVVFKALWDNISGWFVELAKDAWQWGVDLIKGFAGGIQSMVSSVMNTVSNLANSVTSKIKGALGIHSPSTVFEGIGANLGKGLALGIEGAEGLVNRAMAGITPTINTNPAAAGAGGGQVIFQWSSLATPSDAELQTVFGKFDRYIAQRVR